MKKAKKLILLCGLCGVFSLVRNTDFVEKQVSNMYAGIGYAMGNAGYSSEKQAFMSLVGVAHSTASAAIYGAVFGAGVGAAAGAVVGF